MFIKFFNIIVILVYFVNNLLLSQQASIVNVDLILKEKINQTIPIIGSIGAKKNTNIMAPVNGRIDKVFVEEGDVVKKGRVLANIDIRNYKYHLEIAKADMEKSKSLYEISKLETKSNALDLNRMKALIKSSSFNKSKFDKLENQSLIQIAKEKTAFSDLAIKKNLYNIALLNFEKSSVKALFDGVIEEKHIEAGEVVNIGSQMFQLLSKEKIEIFAEVPTNKIHNLSVGDYIKFSTSDKINFEGKVRSLGKKENNKTRTAKLFLDFVYERNYKKRELLAGESVNLYIPVAKTKKHLTIHKDAILKREGMSLAYIVKNNKVEIRALKLGEAVGNRFIVVEGVNENDQVVVKGNERLRPGQEVSVIEKK